VKISQVPLLFIFSIVEIVIDRFKITNLKAYRRCISLLFKNNIGDINPVNVLYNTLIHDFFIMHCSC